MLHLCAVESILNFPMLGPNKRSSYLILSYQGHHKTNSAVTSDISCAGAKWITVPCGCTERDSELWLYNTHFARVLFWFCFAHCSDWQGYSRAKTGGKRKSWERSRMKWAVLCRFKDHEWLSSRHTVQLATSEIKSRVCCTYCCVLCLCCPPVVEQA